MTTETTNLTRAISAEVKKVLDRELDDDANFFAEGLDSLAALELTVQLEDTLGIACFLEDVFEAATVTSLAARLAERS